MSKLGFLFRDGLGRLEDKSNNFTAMRIAFAMIVLYGHAIVIPMGKPYVGAWGLTVDFITKGPALTASRLAGKKLCIIFADGYTQARPQTRPDVLV